MTRLTFERKAALVRIARLRLIVELSIDLAYCSLRNEMGRNEMERNEMGRNEMGRNEMEICSLRNENL